MLQKQGLRNLKYVLCSITAHYLMHQYQKYRYINNMTPY